MSGDSILATISVRKGLWKARQAMTMGQGRQYSNEVPWEYLREDCWSRRGWREHAGEQERLRRRAG